MSYSLTATSSFQVAYTYSLSVAGFNPPGIQNTNSQSGRNRYSTGNQASQANRMYSALFNIAASASTNINLQSFIDAVNQAGTNLASVTTLAVQLLSPTQTGSDGTNTGTNCSQIIVGGGTNNFANVALPMYGTNFSVYKGGFAAFDAPTNTGIAVTNANRNIQITNADSGNIAIGYITILGRSV